MARNNIFQSSQKNFLSTGPNLSFKLWFLNNYVQISLAHHKFSLVQMNFSSLGLWISVFSMKTVKCIFFQENVSILIQISIDNWSALVQLMPCCLLTELFNYWQQTRDEEWWRIWNRKTYLLWEMNKWIKQKLITKWVKLWQLKSLPHCYWQSHPWLLQWLIKGLTHWGQVTHICISKLTVIGSDNGLSPGRRQAIIWTNVGILLIRTSGTNFNEIHMFLFIKMHLKMLSGKWQPFCLGFSELKSNSNRLPHVISHIDMLSHIARLRRIFFWFMMVQKWLSSIMIFSTYLHIPPSILFTKLFPQWFYYSIEIVCMIHFNQPRTFYGDPVQLIKFGSQWPGGRFKNAYELLNLRALKFSPANKMHIFQCMGKIFCVEFQRVPLKFHTKYLAHTLKDAIFIQRQNFKNS